MTYFGVLGVFIVPPLVALIALLASRSRSADWLPYVAVLTLAVIAVVYTAPWDNYLVATSVWWYDEALVSGVTIGWVPIEEYLFFALQTVLTGLWTVFLTLPQKWFMKVARLSNFVKGCGYVDNMKGGGAKRIYVRGVPRGKGSEKR